MQSITFGARRGNSRHQRKTLRLCTQATLPTPISVSDLLTSTNINTNVNGTKSGTSSTSTIDLINEFADPRPAIPTSIGTSTPISLLLSSIQDIATLSEFGSRSSTTLLASGTVALQPINSQQTFTSTDLSNSIPHTTVRPASSFGKILEQMKQVLLGMLERLKPFGGLTREPDMRYAE